MNIFYLDNDPKIAAQSMVDSHVVKMILESAQLLSTAHRVLDGYEHQTITDSNRKKKVWTLPDSNMDKALYQATHVNHPSALWVRQSKENYDWLYLHFEALLIEYTYRYGKIHKCQDLLDVLYECPKNINKTVKFTPPTEAMDVSYKVSSCAIENYRNYYRKGKQHLFRWKRRNPPSWLNESSNQVSSLFA